MPKISVVLPTYNGEKFLSQSIQSVIDSSFTDWELIIVNDCSSDRSLDIAQEFAKKDQRIKIISNKKNEKLPASLNIGFAVAKGKYYTWTSDDNLFKPNALELMCKYLDDHPDIDLVSMNADIINENGKVLHDFEASYTYQRCVEYLLQGCNIGAAFMYRKNIADKVGKYNTNTFCAEDYDYWCRIALKGNIAYTSNNIYQYRIQNNSLSATQKQQVIKKTKLIKEQYIEKFFRKYNYTNRDRALIWYNSQIKNRPFQYSQYYLAFRFNRFISQFIASMFFWNKDLRKNIRKKLNSNNKYSFSILRK